MNDFTKSPDNAAIEWLHGALRLSDGQQPFCWQIALLNAFLNQNIPRSLDIPTGLGKTAVMAIWLIARACGAKELPRRLVYVVDRRAVVDQATEVATNLHDFVNSNETIKNALSFELGQSLPISTLRGQFVDNRKWLENPASPSIVIGTVDMIGSRILFEGYGVSRKMRPFHAGLLGADSIIVLDESHLVPPFEKLVETIVDDRNGREKTLNEFGAREEELNCIVPKIHLLSLSATGKSSRSTFGLTPDDLRPSTITRKRLDAKKRLTFCDINDSKELVESLAKQAWLLTEKGTKAARIIVFCDKRKDAEAVNDALRRLVKGDKKQGIESIKIDSELFVGGRRVFERESAAKRLKKLGFLAGETITPPLPTFLCATSAAEVGVDLDADHMVCDLVPWERMVQRLGRVNRRGDGDAQVVVVVEPPPKPSKTVENALKATPDERTTKQIDAITKYEMQVAETRIYRTAIEKLPKTNDWRDASPGAIRNLKLQNDETIQCALEDATTPPPLRPALTRPLVDSWSMTSLDEHTGRPFVEPWLRGWIDDEPQTVVAWRKYLPVRENFVPTGKKEKEWKEMELFFEAAPIHVSEELETETYRVLDWLTKRATTISKLGNEESKVELLKPNNVAAIVLDSARNVVGTMTLASFDFDESDKKVVKRKKDSLFHLITGKTVVVDARFAGLSNDGLLEPSNGNPPPTADDTGTWLRESGEPVIKFRITVEASDNTTTPSSELPSNVSNWKERYRFVLDSEPDVDSPASLVVEKWKTDASMEEDRSTGFFQLLDEHQSWAEEQATDIATQLALPPPYVRMLGLAARFHDEGKRAKQWQRAFHARDDAAYAKTPGPIDFKLLNRYRHELGTLIRIEHNERGQFNELHELPKHLRDLALHLIAAHHGFARPVIVTVGCEDAPPSVLEARARDVALRFVRLQNRWGPWGLAWWESLMRAADQQASREAVTTPSSKERD